MLCSLLALLCSCTELRIFLAMCCAHLLGRFYSSCEYLEPLRDTNALTKYHSRV
ncbi:hypothetical protein M758_7G061500 [Ceratodon purpureus]|uniref:Secreted protein n=1 Tax=Ceratodon purpureus TaxID=3225 RepID=A0A8T0H895_CERPU|nr:hypothetical protein KC19_7G064700 [Ceratodon purpureus]KAG0610384.1 hypothetical protein M758_7G061500 [Ceratodon purpureus]